MLPLIDLNFFDHLLIFLLGVVMPWRTIESQKKLKNMTFSTATKIQLYYGNSMGLWLMAIFVAVLWWLSGRTITGLGLWPFFPPLSSPALLLIALFIVLYAIDAFLEVGISHRRIRTISRWRREMAFLPENGREFQHFTFLSLTAGVCEEIVFRGFFICYFYAVLHPFDAPNWLAVVLPAILFGIVHYYQGWKAILKIVLMALIFGLIFVWTGNLWWLILLHILVDLIGGALSWRLGLPPDEFSESTSQEV